MNVWSPPGPNPPAPLNITPIWCYWLPMCSMWAEHIWSGLTRGHAHRNNTAVSDRTCCFCSFMCSSPFLNNSLPFSSLFLFFLGKKNWLWRRLPLVFYDNMEDMEIAGSWSWVRTGLCIVSVSNTSPGCRTLWYLWWSALDKLAICAGYKVRTEHFSCAHERRSYSVDLAAVAHDSIQNSKKLHMPLLYVYRR